MRRLHFPTLVLSALLLAGNAAADTPLIGIAAPLTGPSGSLGQQMRDGATAAATAEFALDIADDACTAAGGTNAARKFAAAKVRIVVGFLCTEAIEAALPLLKDANIPVITIGVRTDSLTDRREKTGWPVFRLGPRADDERMAAATILTRLWSAELFAIIDDGTIYGRELAESFRGAAEQAGLKPVYVDTFRPQSDNQIGLVGRLRKAGATHVFVGGDRDDVAIMGRDAAELDAGMTFASGEALRAAPGDVALEAGTLMIGLPDWAELAGPTALAALAAREIAPDGYVLPAYAAIEVAMEAIAPAGQPDALPVEALTGRDFSTAIGSVRFNEKGDLSDNLYRAFRFDGSRFVPLEVE